ncbi:hypothetical protein D6D24_06738 [Aureobasidium pullulans]|uniref:Ubiquitin 3 binding protein But2 C-terminal domain-containing protein n=1 Tax=Aureobasidium pullulans TaxID=5580 RepID=A0A4S8VJP2_AURPU|nr:hypothetical protein D6D24_06738 [Aureobasidium pullulans]
MVEVFFRVNHYFIHSLKMNSIKAASVLSFFGTLAAAWPMNTTSSAVTSFACNPAHSYPGGVSCISTAGSLTLVSPSASATSSGYACNPAHSYPNNAVCTEVKGSLTLVTPTAWTTSTTVYTTDYVTVCPTPTVVTINSKTITVTSATTLTVPCPTTAVVTKPVLVGPTASAPAPSASATGNCADKYNTCRTTRVNGLSANQAQCASENAACQGACYAAYNTCRTTRVNGLSANQAQCASEYAGCLGENPIASSGGLISSFIPYSATASSSAAPSSPAASKPASSAPANQPPASSAPASSAPVAAPSQPAASNGVCAPPQTVTVTQYVTVSKGETPKAPSSAPATTQKPSSAASASACATQLFDGCNPARSSCPNGPGTFITVTPSTYPTSYVVNGQTVSFTAAPTSCLPSSSAAMSSKASSSAPASSKPASSAPASSKASGSAPAPSATPAGKCPLDLKAGAYEYPHALRVNGVNGYNITVNRDTKTDVVFDIPQADAGKTCNTYFSLPNTADLVTAAYSLSLVDGAKINVSKDGKVVSSFTPESGKAYLIESGKCAAGQALTYTFSTGDSLTLNAFNDWNACALGAFVTVA